MIMTKPDITRSLRIKQNVYFAIQGNRITRSTNYKLVLKGKLHSAREKHRIAWYTQNNGNK